ncbi:hypothetical protein ACQ4PT_064475 [Festuca glaucescens]
MLHPGTYAIPGNQVLAAGARRPVGAHAGRLPPLNSTDKSRLCRPFTSLHIFDRAIHESAETVRRALSRALVHYHPIAGRLTVCTGDGDSNFQIACTGEGVAFVAATANCTLEDARFLHTPLALPLADLALRYGGRCRLSDPLLMAQVTEFACGGYVLAVTWNHAIANGFGVAQFLQAVGELARGLSSPSVLPVRYDGSLPEIPQLATALGPRLAGCEHINFTYTDVTIPWSFINRVKAELFQQGRGHASGRLSCSTFEVVAAAIWQCRTQAITKGHFFWAYAYREAGLSILNRVGAKDGYYGNCIMSQVITAASSAIADGNIVEVVKLVKRGKEMITSTLEGGERPVVLGEEIVGTIYGYSMLVLTSWGGIGLEDMDLGGGRPARVIANIEMTVLPSSVMCPLCSKNDGSDGKGDGVNVVAFCVREEHADGFHEELARLR